MQLIIDVVGGCNLKCPSCPVGNMSKNKGSVKSVMRIDLLDKIMDKAIRDIKNLEFVALYNWTEPLLHPNISEIISLIKKKGVPVHLSSNLNILKSPDELMASNPDYFRVSLSGFNQDTYSWSHRGGDISIVKRNMAKLMDSKNKFKASTIMTVLFHKYVRNMDEELEMKAFSEELGYRFESVWAYLMPLEKLLTYTGYEVIGTEINDKDWEVIDNLALSPADAVIQARKYAYNSCWLKSNQLVLDSSGQIVLCCAVFNQYEHALGSFLDLSFDEIVRKKYDSHAMKTCVPCMNEGLHVLGVYGAKEFEDVAQKNLTVYY